MNRFVTAFLLALVCWVVLACQARDLTTPIAEAENNVRPTPTPQSAKPTTIAAVGDIMLSRGVARAISRDGNPQLPFEKMTDVFRSTDFNFGNLEAPVSGKDDVLGKGLIFNTDSRHIGGLRAHNFKILNLANNHALDQGIEGLRQTQNFLSAENLQFVGAGENLDAAWKPKIIDVQGVRIGFVGASYSSYNDGGAEMNDYVARIEHLRDAFDCRLGYRSGGNHDPSNARGWKRCS